MLDRKKTQELSIAELKGLLQSKTMEIITAQEEFRKEADFGITDNPRSAFIRKANRRKSMDLSLLHKEFRIISNAYDNALRRE